ncbi:Sec34-domain-containing protein [Dichomitus squalens]|uniref:Conserved oligomeric Golgi complex subunit 3 n=1 Tax=Dichomitus squalens TaxID=114155 RepID=A0A4Q9PYK3_9APHY|nr:Sec34-domain-containing protein [Dichomitus squalens]TBU59709.1 Sec34-domain-containing protein [Dichomitus squalens]
MAANSKRPANLATLTLHAKSTITVEEWEAAAPLGDVETRSISFVQSASQRSTLPPKLSVEEPGSSSRPSTPIIRGKLGQSSRPSTPHIVGGHRPSAAHSLHPKQPIQTPQQFYDWYALIDRSVTHSQEAHIRAHLGTVSDHLETCDRLVQRIDEIDREVEDMLSGWRSVEESGRSLKEACEQLLQERDRILDMTIAIDERLEYFQELEQATRMLNHPGESLVLQGDFLYMVERVDICIDYLKAHRHFKEAEIYLLRFQQCMTRAMTLIKMYFVGSLRALTADVSKRLSEKDVSTTAQTHLLYTRFRSVSGPLAPLLAELERRARDHPDELAALLAECHTAYFSARKALLVNRLMEEIRGLDPARTELVELTRAGCSYLKQLCTDEFTLFRAFFNSGEEQLYQYLESLCDYLYDDLRPRILHEPRLTALCEVCTVLQALMVLDIPSLPESPSDEEGDLDELTLDLDQPRRQKGLRTLHISHLLQMVLQDAQTRLFFKAQSVIQSEIRYYVPKPEDLAYPDKLLAARKPLSGTEIKEKQSINQIFQLKSLDKQETWYPTLQETVWVLSQLKDFVKPAIFDDLAQEAINYCRQTLVGAAETLKSRNPPSSVFEGQLFLARHLLILKEMTQNLDLVHRNVDRGLDLSGVNETLASMLGRTTSLLPNALLASLGMPRDEDMTDVRHGIDQELKQACEDVIQSGIDAVSGGVRAWAEKVRATYALDNDPVGPSGKTILPRLGSAPDSTWAGIEAAQSYIDRMYSKLERDVHRVSMSLRLYIEDERTVEVLLKHVQDKIVDDWMDFSDLISNLYNGAMRARAPIEEFVRAKVVRGSKEDWVAQSNGGVMWPDSSSSSNVTS